jgi:hypothetical protein
MIIFKKEGNMTMTNKMKRTNRAERGNALFLILIAVALFAALSYAVTQSGRGGGTVDRETAMISAGQITQYPSALRTAVTRMVITGTPVSGVGGVDFACAGASNCVFDGLGGGAAVQAPPANVGTITLGGTAGATANAWGYKGALDASLGYYIEGVGTNTNVTGRDAVAYLHGVTSSICQQILKGLGLTTVIAGSQGALNLALGAGGAGSAVKEALFTNVLGVAGSAPAFSCTSADTTPADGPFVYYHALIEQ